MTFYITPSGRIRRFRMDRLVPDYEESSRVESEVYFPVDILAENDSYVISALLPGVNPDDVSVQILNETVTIEGEVKDERQDGKNYLLAERPTGRFSRILTLPAPLDAARAEANVENGVLTLRIPKAESARPRTIKVATK